MRPGGIGVGTVAVAELLGQVLRQIADAPVSVLGPGEHTLSVEPCAEPGHVVGLAAELVQRLVPAGQDFPGGRIKAAPLCGAGSGAPRAGLCVGTPARHARAVPAIAVPPI